MDNKPLKRFGQNYLTDKNIIEKIITAFNPEIAESVIEIGPGRGALTEKLYGRTKNLCAIEIDKRVIENLKEKFPNVNFFNKDFLEISFADLPCNAPFRIIGNIPYNITAPILFKLIDERKNISDALLMVQYEVAERLTSEKRNKKYGLLTVILNYFADVKLLFKISPNVFYPKPKVHSAIISIKFRPFQIIAKDEQLFVSLVKASFANRRKLVKNSLSNSIFKTYVEKINNFDFSKRAEEYGIKDFVNLANLIYEIKNDEKQKR